VIRVLVAEDMRILRDTPVAVLNLEDDIDVVAEVADGDAIVPAVVAERPDVAVVDIDLPGTDGLAAAAALHDRRLCQRRGRPHRAALRSRLGVAGEADRGRRAS
jgi:DNA-binding NarL/FixJ family response regulator